MVGNSNKAHPSSGVMRNWRVLKAFPYRRKVRNETLVTEELFLGTVVDYRPVMELPQAKRKRLGNEALAKGQYRVSFDCGKMEDMSPDEVIHGAKLYHEQRLARLGHRHMQDTISSRLVLSTTDFPPEENEQRGIRLLCSHSNHYLGKDALAELEEERLNHWKTQSAFAKGNLSRPKSLSSGDEWPFWWDPVFSLGGHADAEVERVCNKERQCPAFDRRSVEPPEHKGDRAGAATFGPRNGKENGNENGALKSATQMPPAPESPVTTPRRVTTGVSSPGVVHASLNSDDSLLTGTRELPLFPQPKFHQKSPLSWNYTGHHMDLASLSGGRPGEDCLHVPPAMKATDRGCSLGSNASSIWSVRSFDSLTPPVPIARNMDEPLAQEAPVEDVCVAFEEPKFSTEDSHPRQVSRGRSGGANSTHSPQIDFMHGATQTSLWVPPQDCQQPELNTRKMSSSAEDRDKTPDRSNRKRRDPPTSSWYAQHGSDYPRLAWRHPTSRSFPAESVACDGHWDSSHFGRAPARSASVPARQAQLKPQSRGLSVTFSNPPAQVYNTEPKMGGDRQHPSSLQQRASSMSPQGPPCPSYRAGLGFSPPEPPQNAPNETGAPAFDLGAWLKGSPTNGPPGPPHPPDINRHPSEGWHPQYHPPARQGPMHAHTHVGAATRPVGNPQYAPRSWTQPTSGPGTGRPADPHHYSMFMERSGYTAGKPGPCNGYYAHYQHPHPTNHPYLPPAFVPPPEHFQRGGPPTSMKPDRIGRQRSASRTDCPGFARGWDSEPAATVFRKRRRHHFGQPHPDIAEGAGLYSRLQLFLYGAHRSDVSPVHGTKAEGCDSILFRQPLNLSSRKDDIGMIKFTCCGKKGGTALYSSHLRNLPVRVFRIARANSRAYRYDGLYSVIALFDDRGCPRSELPSTAIDRVEFLLKRNPKEDTHGGVVAESGRFFNKLNLDEMWGQVQAASWGAAGSTPQGASNSDQLNGKPNMAKPERCSSQNDGLQQFGSTEKPRASGGATRPPRPAALTSRSRTTSAEVSLLHIRYFMNDDDGNGESVGKDGFDIKSGKEVPQGPSADLMSSAIEKFLNPDGNHDLSNAEMSFQTATVKFPEGSAI